MGNSLKRVLDRLRTATSERFGKPTSVRVGAQVPQRLKALRASALSRRAS